MHTTEFQAIYIDFDNVFEALAPAGGGSTNKLLRLMKYLQYRGPIAQKRAYGNWRWQRRSAGSDERRYHEDELRAGAFELIQVFGAHANLREGKNHADIRLALDAFEAALQHPHIQHFVIVSNDSDFMPLISRLHMLGRQVIGIGSRGDGQKRSICRYLASVYDEFLYIEDILDIVEGQARQAVEAQKTLPSLSEARLNVQREDHASPQAKARALLRQALSASDLGESPLHLSKLKTALVKLDPTFDQRVLGVEKFSAWLSQQSDIVTLGYEGDQPHVQPAKGTRPHD